MNVTIKNTDLMTEFGISETMKDFLNEIRIIRNIYNRRTSDGTGIPNMTVNRRKNILKIGLYRTLDTSKEIALFNAEISLKLMKEDIWFKMSYDYEDYVLIIDLDSIIPNQSLDDLLRIFYSNLIDCNNDLIEYLRRV